MADELPADPPDITASTDGLAAPSVDAVAGAADAIAGGELALPAGGRAGQVTRSVEVDAAVADVWSAVTDPAERALWLDDPDARARHVRVDESAPGQRLVWTWWRPGDEGAASTVSIVLSPVDGGGTRVVITEVAPAASPSGSVSPGGASAGSARASSAGAARRAPSWVRCASDRWDGRLLGLELLFVAARAGVV